MSWKRNVFAIATASFVGFTGFTLVMPFLPLYFQQLGVADVGEVALWSGVSFGVTPAMTALLAPFWGRLSDRFGRKIMVERSLVSFIFLMAGMAYVTQAWHVVALRAVQGLFAGYGGIALTMAAESAPPEHTAQAIGTVQTAQRLGPALGPIFGGLVAQAVGLRNAFLVTACFYVAALLVVLILYKEDHPGRHHSGRERREPLSFRSVLAFENFVLLMAVVFALQLVDRVALLSGMVFSTAAAAGAVGNQMCASLFRHVSPRAVIAGSTTLGAVGAVIYAAAPGTAWLFVATPVFGLAMGVATTSTYTAASSVMPQSARGAGFGLLQTASLTGVALSPILSGFLGATSIRAVFLLDVFALMALAAAVSRLMVIAPLEKPTTPSPEEL